MQDFISGSSITQGDYEVISIHLDNADIIKNERMEKAVPLVKPNLSRQVDYHFFPFIPIFLDKFINAKISKLPILLSRILLF